MRADWPDADAASIVLRVDGGMTASDWTMQRLADLLDAPVDRPMIQETTALGAAYLAGLSAGIYPEPQQFADNWRLEHRFKPAMSAATRERKLKGWAAAVRGLLATRRGRGMKQALMPASRRHSGNARRARRQADSSRLLRSSAGDDCGSPGAQAAAVPECTHGRFRVRPPLTPSCAPE